jgi:hypothetical protein
MGLQPLMLMTSGTIVGALIDLPLLRSTEDFQVTIPSILRSDGSGRIVVNQSIRSFSGFF